MADTEYQEEAPSGEVTQDEYTSRTGQKDANVPVQDNNAPIEDPIDPATADSDQQLARDDADAIDKGNIVDERTRHAKPAGGYREPGDTEGIEQ